MFVRGALAGVATKLNSFFSVIWTRPRLKTADTHKAQADKLRQVAQLLLHGLLGLLVDLQVQPEHGAHKSYELTIVSLTL